MCQLSGISKTGTKQNSTRIVDGYLFSTDYALSTHLNLEHVVLNGGHWLSTVTVFSATASKCFLRGLWNNNTRVWMFPQRTAERIPSP